MDVFLLNFWRLSGSKVNEFCRSRQELSDEIHLLMSIDLRKSASIPRRTSLSKSGGASCHFFQRRSEECRRRRQGRDREGAGAGGGPGGRRGRQGRRGAVVPRRARADGGRNFRRLPHHVPESSFFCFSMFFVMFVFRCSCRPSAERARPGGFFVCKN